MSRLLLDLRAAWNRPDISDPLFAEDAAMARFLDATEALDATGRGWRITLIPWDSPLEADTDPSRK